jgi:hypothetical protein
VSGEGGAIAEVLAAHVQVTGYDEIGVWFNYACSCSAFGDSDEWHREHVAEVLADLLAAERQRGRAEERAGECRRLAARACRNAEGRTGADADWWNRTAAWLMGHAATADREATR